MSQSVDFKHFSKWGRLHSHCKSFFFRTILIALRQLRFEGLAWSTGPIAFKTIDSNHSCLRFSGRGSGLLRKRHFVASLSGMRLGREIEKVHMRQNAIEVPKGRAMYMRCRGLPRCCQNDLSSTFSTFSRAQKMTGRVSSGNLTGTCKCNFRCLSLREAPVPPLQKPRHVEVEGAPTWVRFGLITTSGVRFGFLRPSHVESASEPSIRPPWWHSESGTPAGQGHMHAMLLILKFEKEIWPRGWGSSSSPGRVRLSLFQRQKQNPWGTGNGSLHHSHLGCRHKGTVQPMSAHGCARKMYLKPNQCNAFTRFSFWNHMRSEITTLRLRTRRRNDNNKGRTIRDLISKSCKQSI